ncbi:hypothetical protein [Lysinibacillus fusiformis]|uniref:hypothetical protein n=1 Tax=Lysinibacillus fusiformis TaxID=28031 RepID=UPI000469B4FB|nr:hypothetical protein [Lysinibacillus fusiformis]
MMNLQVYLKEVEHYFFSIGALSVAYISVPSVIDTIKSINCINIIDDEFIRELGEGKILLQKKMQ